MSSISGIEPGPSSPPVTAAQLGLGLPVLAVLLASAIFAAFVALYGQNPVTVFGLIVQGGFGSSFAWQDTLSRAAPLVLVGLAVAIPAQAGLVIIGGEGALVLGGLAGAVVTLPFAGAHALPMQLLMSLAGALIGGLWFGLAGVLRQYRGLNETISSLLLSYIGIAIFHHLTEGLLRDPASLDKPSTHPIDPSYMLPVMPGVGVHAGLAASLSLAVIAHVVLRYTRWGFALRVVGGSARVAKMMGLAVNRWIIGASVVAGGMAGIAGAIEVAAVQGTANSSLIVGYGYSGILVAFLARHQPLAIVAVALLIGGMQASASLLQRRLGLPDATMLVFQGLIFVCVLVADAIAQQLRETTRR
ncbi:ABC transporter permease [Bradyrhizobium sp. IC3069]|uniref:ABC transporter permease n=1 Tax=unclassified Bradyrhizobium TaxID=2631580 RepID=UPI001CD3FC5A|nr:MULTISPECIES: ABC transporter permease [unclassified Bradyrhizobium]MCA1411386.1 ABC transporter permease [Bradyrhizobium sp. NBAIM20]MCA1460753.1 ABC transporter permease [Bradyrhizobium sp. NBAIM18]MCA1518224.1 ABC transporter permease [Bradyrhizobium sp. IC3069]